MEAPMLPPSPVRKLRVLTLNLWGHGGQWEQRRTAIAAGLRTLKPDLIAFIEAVKTDRDDQVAEILGPDFHIVQQVKHREADGRGAAIASRWQPANVREVDL